MDGLIPSIEMIFFLTHLPPSHAQTGPIRLANDTV